MAVLVSKVVSFSFPPVCSQLGHQRDLSRNKPGHADLSLLLPVAPLSLGVKAWVFMMTQEAYRMWPLNP